MVFPWATTLVIQASAWKFIIDTDYGTLNTLLLRLGIIEQSVNWTPTLLTSLKDILKTNIIGTRINTAIRIILGRIQI